MMLQQMYFYSWFHHNSLRVNSCVNEDLDEVLNSSFPKIEDVENKLPCLREVKFALNFA